MLVRRPVSRGAKWWWEQDDFDLEEMQMEALEAEWTKGGEEMDRMEMATDDS